MPYALLECDRCLLHELRLTGTLKSHSICDANLCAEYFCVGVGGFALEKLVCLALRGPEVLCTRVTVGWEDRSNGLLDFLQAQVQN